MASAAAAEEAGAAAASAPDDPLPQTVEDLVVFVPLAFGAVLLVTGLLAAAGRLPRNDWIGLRLHELMRNEESWDVGHRAGAPWLVAGGLVDTVAGTALALRHDELGSPSVAGVTLVVVAVVAYTAASMRALSAVRRR